MDFLFVIRVANWFIEKANMEKSTIRQSQLHSLVYMAHALKLAQGKGALVNDTFNATEYGPYAYHLRMYTTSMGGEPFKYLIHSPNPNNIYELCMPVLHKDSEAIEYCETTWKNFRGYAGVVLFRTTRQDGTPWEIAYSKAVNSVITNDSIAAYYKDRLIQQS